MFKTLVGVNTFVSKKGENGIMLHTLRDMESSDGTRMGQSAKVDFVMMNNFESIFGSKPENYDFRDKIGTVMNFEYTDRGFLETVS